MTEKYLLLLKEEFNERSTQNTNYSIRAFARGVGVDYSLLSKIFRGNRKLSKKMMIQIEERIGLFQKSSKSRNLCSNLRSNFDNVIKSRFDLNSIDLLTHWEVLAILEILDKKKKATIFEIANHLDLKEEIVESFLLKLKSINYIELKGGGEFQITGKSSRTTVGIPSLPKLRLLQKKFLQLSLNSIDQISENNRDHSGMTMMIDKRKIPQAKKLIKEFRAKLSALLEKSDRHHAVYQLQISLFPLSNKDWLE